MHEDHSASSKVAFTSVATIMWIMVEIIDELRPQLFRAIVDEAKAGKRAVDERPHAFPERGANDNRA